MLKTFPNPNIARMPLHTVSVAMPLVEEFLGWWVLWRLALCARGAYTVHACQRLKHELELHGVEPVANPELLGVRSVDAGGAAGAGF